jgi:hypothetical protein
MLGAMDDTPAATVMQLTTTMQSPKTPCPSSAAWACKDDLRVSSHTVHSCCSSGLHTRECTYASGAAGMREPSREFGHAGQTCF